MKIVSIKSYKIQNFSSPFVIAEIGINHNGSLSLAKEMIDGAKESGADAVKFQFFQKDKLINPYFKEANKIANLLSQYVLNKEQIVSLKQYAEKKGILFLVTPFDIEGVQFLQKNNQSFYKIASGDINNFLLLEAVAKTKKPLILSTGASTLKEIQQAFMFIKKWNSKIILLHCVSLYPTPEDKINLWTIPFLQNNFSVPVGFSDHTIGIEAMLSASILGTAVIEKHFTLNKKLKGPDHKLSITPSELKKFKLNLKAIMTSTGQYGKELTPQEREGQYWGRRGLVASRTINKNAIVSEKNVMALRPVIGLSTSSFLTIKGRRAKKTIKQGQSITLKDLKKM